VTRVRFAAREEPVVVKTRRVDGPGWGGRHHLRREAVALELLDGTAVVAPRVLGFDDAAGVLVLTDLGAGPTLEAQLLGDDAEAATAGVMALAVAAGRLHAATSGAETEAAHRDRLAVLGTDAGRDRLGLWPGVDRWSAVVAAAEDLGFPSARDAADDVADVHAALVGPGPFGALLHLDLGPHNVVLVGGDRPVAALVDFEGATYGHAGFDASFLRYPFPNYSAHYGVLPPSLSDDAMSAYRAALADGMPAAADDTRFRTMLAFGAAAALAVRVQRLPTLAAAGQSAHDSWRRRVQLVQQIGVFADVAEEAGVLPALRSWFLALAEAMRARWTDASQPPPPVFDALRDV
jgi:hypothetical protein